LAAQASGSFFTFIYTIFQICVFVNGQCVVDLWGSADGNPDYDGDTPCVVFSNTKTITSIALASLVDKNLLDYSEKVST